ncbi:hypothetical protein IKG06_03465 [Candidatus Saccharibacteria bacterium]|nr:hypothetical protein [Candidatus Saccharibacteria bacterium]
MKDIGAGLKKVFQKDKGVLLMMLILFAMGLLLILHTFLHFKAGGTTMYIGYSDIGGFTGGEFLSLWNSGGYRTGGWSEMIVFPILGVILGILHNLFAIQIYNRRGKGFAILMLLLSILVAAGAFLLLMRLLGEI